MCGLVDAIFTKEAFAPEKKTVVKKVSKPRKQKASKPKLSEVERLAKALRVQIEFLRKE